MTKKALGVVCDRPNVTPQQPLGTEAVRSATSMPSPVGDGTYSFSPRLQARVALKHQVLG